jgi:predicted alpha/beta-fold hydrolase
MFSTGQRLPNRRARKQVHAQAFVPPAWLRNPHAMTLTSRYWPRPALLKGIRTEARLFTVSPDSKVLGWCHWQADATRHPTLILLHGLEGCAGSPYMLGLTCKAWRAGCNVIRLNQRNCGGSEHLSPTLYNGGQTDDVWGVITELTSQDGLSALWLGGYSMGGNLALLLAGRLGSPPPFLKGVMAVCPDIDPAACVRALETPGNWIYHHHFVRSMKGLIRRKARLFPGRFDVSRLPAIRTLRALDDAFTAPDGGYESAEDYYEQTGARHVLAHIRVPTLIVTSQDDPFIPFRMFENPALKHNSHIAVIATEHGGHCGFLQRGQPDEDRYWAENRLVERIVEQVKNTGALQLSHMERQGMAKTASDPS